MRYSGNAACVEARESISEDPLLLERIASHRTRCADCRLHAEREEEARRGLVLISERSLDDLARARIQARLGATFDRIAAENAKGKAPRWTLVAAAIAAALLLLWLLPRAVIGPPPREPVFAPFLVAGTSEARLAGAPMIEASEATIVRAAIEGGEVTLIGRGRARIESADALSLESGLLLVHVSRPFEVRAGAVSVHVLGTRFAVERNDDQVRVSVSEGSVDVSSAGVVHRIASGEAWPKDAPAEPRLSARELMPPGDPSGVVVLGGAPSGAIATLDGALLGPTPLIARLSVGEHTLEVQADLHMKHTETIAILDGGVSHVSYDLAPLPIERTEPPKQVAPRSKKNRVTPPEAEPTLVPENAETLYRNAEALLADGNAPAARAVLDDLVARYPNDPLVESAWYELARLDYEEGALEAARTRLITLLARRRDADFAESGQRLLCQIDVETRRYEDANGCWRSFRERFPDSIHDAEALASLIAVAQIWNDCARVRALAEEFMARHSEHALRSEVEARVMRCSD